jgi:hypothetical protein
VESTARKLRRFTAAIGSRNQVSPLPLPVVRLLQNLQLEQVNGIEPIQFNAFFEHDADDLPTFIKSDV